jgi:hypothetical protein
MGEYLLAAPRQRLRRRRACPRPATRDTVAWIDTKGWLARTLASGGRKRGVR